MGSKAQYWSRRLAAIKAEGISIKAYAERESLSLASLYSWHQRLKPDARPSDKPRQFVPVQIMGNGSSSAGGQLTIGRFIQLDFNQLPSPCWLAALAQALAPQER